MLYATLPDIVAWTWKAQAVHLLPLGVVYSIGELVNLPKPSPIGCSMDLGGPPKGAQLEEIHALVRCHSLVVEVLAGSFLL